MNDGGGVGGGSFRVKHGSDAAEGTDVREAGAGEVGERLRTGASEVKVVEDELLEWCIEGSGIFLIWADRPIMMNFVLEGLRRRRLDDIHCEIWLTTERSCAIEVEKEAGEKDMNSWVPSALR